MKYMLDTNICIYIMKQKFDKVNKNFEAHNINDVCVSSITQAELEYGVSKSKFPVQNSYSLELFLSKIKILPFDSKAAKEYGNIRATLEKQGLPIGMNDLLIAAHVRALNLTLVTNNEKEFRRIENLKVENWVKN